MWNNKNQVKNYNIIKQRRSLRESIVNEISKLTVWPPFDNGLMDFSLFAATFLSLAP